MTASPTPLLSGLPAAALPSHNEFPWPIAPDSAHRPMPCDVFCTVERHPGLARPQGSVMSLAG
ncbi:hypothetical protein [Roseateles sp. P5_E7]